MIDWMVYFYKLTERDIVFNFHIFTIMSVRITARESNSLFTVLGGGRTGSTVHYETVTE